MITDEILGVAPEMVTSDVAAAPRDRAAADGVASVMERLQDLRSTLESFGEELRATVRKSDRSAEIIERLEAENAALKRRESERRQEPLIKGVISLFDDMRAVARHAQTHAPTGIDAESRLVQSLVVFERQALELLRGSGVEAFEPRVADVFDARREEAWETVDTPSADDDMRIASVLRLGFEFAGRTLRPAAVSVYRFRASAAATTAATVTTEGMSA